MILNRVYWKLDTLSHTYIMNSWSYWLNCMGYQPVISANNWLIGCQHTWQSALPGVLNHICSTWNPFDLSCDSVTWNYYPFLGLLISTVHYPWPLSLGAQFWLQNLFGFGKGDNGSVASCPLEAASLRGASLKNCLLQRKQHTDGIHLILHFLFYSFAKYSWGSLREVGVFGEKLSIWVHNFKLTQVWTGICHRAVPIIGLAIILAVDLLKYRYISNRNSSINYRCAYRFFLFNAAHKWWPCCQKFQHLKQQYCC